MPAGRHPLATTGNKVLVVQPQYYHRYPPYGSHTNDLTAIVTPAEMLRPLLRSGIEQRGFDAYNRVNTGDLCPLETIAPRTCQPQVAVIGGASYRQRYDMFDVHRRATDPL